MSTIRSLAAAVRDGRVGAHELVRESLRRIEALDPELNAVVALRAEEALEEARGLDEHLASGGEAGPLAGVPALIKDLTDVAGMRTTFGSQLYAGAAPAARDGLPTVRLRAAGAVIVGKTNTPEFATQGFTNNHVFGPTRNPWNRDRTPGGSSGGSGAAVAAGMAPVATATDTAGSIRIPSAYCGLVGLKPTNGVIGREVETRTALEWIDLTTDGPLGATVDDVALLLEALAGPAPGDPTALPGVWHRAAIPGSRRPRRLFVAERWAPGWGPLPPEARSLLDQAVERMAALFGLEPEPVDAATGLGELGNVDEDSFLIVAVELLQALGGPEGFARVRHDLFPATVDLVELALEGSADAYVAARRRRLAYTRWFDDLLGEDAVVLGPVMAQDAMAAEGPPGGAGSTGDAYLTAPQNLTGHPALSVPAGRYESGVSFGLQVTGPRFAEDLLLDIAAAWEEAHPWPLAADGYEPFTG